MLVKAGVEGSVIAKKQRGFDARIQTDIHVQIGRR